MYNNMPDCKQKPSAAKSQRPSSEVEVASSIPVYTSRPISLQEQQSQQSLRHQALNNPVTQSSSPSSSSSEEKLHSSKAPVTPEKRRSEVRESQFREQQPNNQRQPNSPAINRGNRNSVQDTPDITTHVTGIAQKLLFPALNDVSCIFLNRCIY